jgi:hypothetical protein
MVVIPSLIYWFNKMSVCFCGWIYFSFLKSSELMSFRLVFSFLFSLVQRIGSFIDIKEKL